MIIIAFKCADFNTFDREVAANVSRVHRLHPEETRIVVKTLTHILDEHQAPKNIDFMSVDCEGLDLSVLKSLDWSRYTVDVLMVEDHSESVRTATESETALFLAEREFAFVSRINYTSVFVHKSAGTRLR